MGLSPTLASFGQSPALGLHPCIDLSSGTGGCIFRPEKIAVNSVVLLCQLWTQGVKSRGVGAKLPHKTTRRSHHCIGDSRLYFLYDEKRERSVTKDFK